jgi:hypothetical protein
VLVGRNVGGEHRNIYSSDCADFAAGFTLDIPTMKMLKLVEYYFFSDAISFMDSYLGKLFRYVSSNG